MNRTEVAKAVRERVEFFAMNARALGYDGCHKIYIAMDDEEAELLADIGYGQTPGTVLIRTEGLSVSTRVNIIVGWYMESCGLEFVEASYTNGDDSRFVRVVGQGEFDWDEE